MRSFQLFVKLEIAGHHQGGCIMATVSNDTWAVLLRREFCEESLKKHLLLMRVLESCLFSPGFAFVR